MLEFRDDFKIKQMRVACRIASDILNELSSRAKVGANLLELDELAERLCYKNDVKPAFKGYHGFPSSICANLNDIVVHGIPWDYELKDGDILGIDFGVKYKKVFSDLAVTVCIGDCSPEVVQFVDVTKQSVIKACEVAVVGNTIGDIGYAIQSTVEACGYSVVQEMTGHCIGYNLHEEPFIPGYGKKGEGAKLYDGQAIAIEAIIAQGKRIITIDDDDWTTRTQDGKLSALFEHTLVVGQKPEILTNWGCIE